MLDAVFGNFELFLFIMARMTGFIFFNPIFGRRNVPAAARAGMAFFFSVFAVMHFPGEQAQPEINGMIMFMFLVVKEFAVGFLLGLIVNMFFSVVTIAGEVMDMQMGLAMSQMFDPGSGVTMPITGAFYNVALIVLFFLTNSHGVLLRILMISFRIAPVDSIYLNPEIGLFIMQLFGNILILSLNFAFPVMAAELITETGVGIIMRAVPQINVFVVGLQMKILVGISIMLLSAPVAAAFLSGMLHRMGEQAWEAIFILAGR